MTIGLPTFPPPQPAILTACNPPNVDFLGLSFLALAVSVLYVTFFYLWGKLTSNPNLDVWVKGELYEIGATAFIVLVFLPIFLNAACAFNLGGYNIFETAHVYLESLKASMNVVMFLLAIGYMAIDLSPSISIKAVPLGIGLAANDVSAGALALWKPIVHQITNALTLGYVFASAQTMVLEYFTYGMITKILPIGVLLRSFTPTRRVGGTLIGLSIALLFLYPLILTLNYFLVKDYLVVYWDVNSKVWKLDEGIKTTLNDIFATLNPFYVEKNPSAWERIFKWFTVILSIVGLIGLGLASGYGYVLVALGIIILIWPFLITGAYLGLVAGLIMPAINTVILIQGVRYFTYIFGEELDISTLTRLV